MTTSQVVIPTIRLPRELDPRFQPHVLVITGDNADEREWEIEHPRFCPRSCFWGPGMRELVERERAAERGQLSLEPFDHYDCYVEWEVTNVGLDSLELDDAPDDGSYTPRSPWALDRWRQLPEGRYLIEGWFEPFHWAGSEPCDAEGGIVLLGPELS